MSLLRDLLSNLAVITAFSAKMIVSPTARPVVVEWEHADDVAREPGGQMTRMFRRWLLIVNQFGGCWSASDFTPAVSIQNFWEAEVLSPRFSTAAVPRGDVKMILGMFSEFYGTADEATRPAWCQKNAEWMGAGLGARPGAGLPARCGPLQPALPRPAR
jgi:hypothetical protein